MNKDTEQLVLNAARGDTDAFTELVRIYLNKMYRTAYAILMNDEDSADAIQDTLLIIWKRIPTLRNPAYFQTWCTRILMNRCFRMRKERQREISLDEVAERRDLSAEDQRSLEWKEALSVLDEKYRIPMELFYGQGYRISEIAEMLQVPVSTVQTRLSRGRKRIAVYYKD